MRYPKMILFDYGHTLACETGFDFAKGNAELWKYVTKNPNNCTLADVRRVSDLIYGTYIEEVRKAGYEICSQVADKVLYEYLGIEFSLTPLEMESIFWNAVSMGAIMPDADKMLDYINGAGIRSAVISNLVWSGDALTERIGRLLPNNRFEFIMTSSGYFLRKPNRILFDIALQKAQLKADEVWYCGDNLQADVEGSSQAGIYPVWYDNKNKDCSGGHMVQCEHLHIHEWSEMIDILEKLAGFFAGTLSFTKSSPYKAEDGGCRPLP